MIRAVADTHALIWFVWADPRFSAAARAIFVAAVASGEKVAISSISLVEVVYLAEKWKIDPDTLDRIRDYIGPGELFLEIPVDQSIIPSLKAIARAQVPDMPDRIIAATAAHLGVPLISRDGKIRASSITTIWYASPVGIGEEDAPCP